MFEVKHVIVFSKSSDFLGGHAENGENGENAENREHAENAEQAENADFY